MDTSKWILSMYFIINRKGDYHRYLAEFSLDSKRKSASDESLAAYKTAVEIAALELTPTHPIRYVCNDNNNNDDE